MKRMKGILDSRSGPSSEASSNILEQIDHLLLALVDPLKTRTSSVKRKELGGVERDTEVREREKRKRSRVIISLIKTTEKMEIDMDP